MTEERKRAILQPRLESSANLHFGKPVLGEYKDEAAGSEGIAGTAFLYNHFIRATCYWASVCVSIDRNRNDNFIRHGSV